MSAPWARDSTLPPSSAPAKGIAVLRKRSAPSQPRGRETRIPACFRRVPTAWARASHMATENGLGARLGPRRKHHSQQRLPRPVIGASGVRGGRSGARRGSCEKSKHKRGPAGPRAARPGTPRPSGPSAVHGADPAPGGRARGRLPPECVTASTPCRPWQATRRVH